MCHIATLLSRRFPKNIDIKINILQKYELSNPKFPPTTKISPQTKWTCLFQI